MSRLTTAAAVLLALALVACGDDDGEITSQADEVAAPAATPDLDVCELLSAEEIEAVVGGSIPAGEVFPAPGTAGCSYGDAALVRYATSDPANVDALRSNLVEPEDVSGVGEDAVYGVSGSGPELSVVFDGDQHLVITVRKKGTTPEQLSELAETAIGRI